MNEPPFLTKDEVLYIHEQQLVAYGGQDGIRDLGLDAMKAIGTKTLSKDGLEKLLAKLGGKNP